MSENNIDKNSEKNEVIKPVEENDKKINDDPYYTKDNIYYKREKRLNKFLLILIFIFLIYIWYCFTYHLGYIKKSTDVNELKNETVDTSRAN